MTMTSAPTESIPTPPAPSARVGVGAQMRPWGAMGALVVAAGASRLAANATGAELETTVFVAGSAFVIAVVASMRSGRRTMDRRLRHRLVAALYLGATWLTLVTYDGMSWGAVAALTILGSGLSLLYWREHRIESAAAPKPAAMPQVQEEDLYVRRWADNLGDKTRALAGSTLTDGRIIKSGYRYTLALVPGVHTVAQVRIMNETLRSGLGLMPGQEVIVEVHPELPAPNALLTIVTRSEVTTKTQEWPGPQAGFDSDRGAVNLGPFVDGEGVAQWSVYRQNGIFGGYLQGAPGSGKSRMIESVAMSCAASESHPTLIWYGDGQSGDSSPMLVEHADFAATSFEGIYNMLFAATKVMEVNGAENRLAKRVGFTPTAARPGLLVIIDECHKPLDASQNQLLAGPTQALAATIAREGRKVGVALIMASQSPTLDAFGGAGQSADTLRASLLAGNGVILRSETSNAKMVFNVDVNPREFPQVPGYAFLSRPEVGARSAPFRGFHVTDDLAKVWPDRIRWRSLPHRQANHAGKHYLHRHETAARQTQDDELLLQMLDAGTVTEFEELAEQVAAQPVSSDGMPAVEPVAKPWEPIPLKPGHHKILDALAGGAKKLGELQTVTGYSETQVRNLLGDLISNGDVRRVVPEGGKLGWYEQTATRQRAA